MNATTRNIAAENQRFALTRFRREARARGLSWAAVQAAYWQIKQGEQEKREHPNTIRQAAWYIATARTPGCWDFWRHGFIARWGRHVDLHDYTAVPDYDGSACPRERPCTAPRWTWPSARPVGRPRSKRASRRSSSRCEFSASIRCTLGRSCMG